jgi:hypothetical protein
VAATTLLAISALASTAGAVYTGVSQASEARAAAQAAEVDRQRRDRDLARQTQQQTASRTALLAISGGLDVGAGSELINEVLYEGALARERSSSDLRLQQGQLSRRATSATVGAGLQAVGSLAQGGARIGRVNEWFG